MSHLYLNASALMGLEKIPLEKTTARILWVGIGDDEYELRLVRLPKDMTRTDPPAMASTPSWAECAEVIGYLFSRLMSLNGSRGNIEHRTPNIEHRSEEQMVPNFEAGWEMYRRQLAETAAYHVPSWHDLSMEVRECFCAGVWEALENPNDEILKLLEGLKVGPCSIEYLADALGIKGDNKESKLNSRLRRYLGRAFSNNRFFRKYGPCFIMVKGGAR